MSDDTRPYNEAIGRQAMRLHEVDGNINGIRQLRRDLIRHLADIQAEPDDETIALADRRPHDDTRARRGGRP